MNSLVPPVKENEEHTVKIETLGDKGDGIAKIQNFAIIIKGEVAVDDNVKVKITRVMDRYAFAEVIENEEEE